MYIAITKQHQGEILKEALKILSSILKRKTRDIENENNHYQISRNQVC